MLVMLRFRLYCRGYNIGQKRIGSLFEHLLSIIDVYVYNTQQMLIVYSLISGEICRLFMVAKKTLGATEKALKITFYIKINCVKFMGTKKTVKDGVLLLHLSDIHFREPYCLNLNTDQEHPVRTALLSDIRNMVKTLGPVDAVLVTGDIAYKGHPDEYKVAAKWLLDVTRLAKCKENAVYTVPGNHDVNRNTAGNRITKGIRKTITEHNEIHKRDKELYDTLHDDKSGLELILPMEEYNKFSAITM